MDLTGVLFFFVWVCYNEHIKPKQCERDCI